ncbi:MAG: hypothetical protein JNN05_08880 [Candidatus Omnitrophica bacterium]|nr:hypothetical protein [Candidatus Omnitrophota bacterium]
MVKKTKKQKVVEAKPVIKNTRQELMLQAKDRGIKNFRVLNKEELQAVLVDGVTQEQVDNVVSGAVARWKSGWGSKKDKS